MFRFASNKYSNDSACVDDVYMHLTNYSINKKSSNYTQNEDSESCQEYFILFKIYNKIYKHNKIVFFGNLE